jgi:glycosyltransferase involved in cell wall biosynthesis
MCRKEASIIINTKDRISRLYVVLKALEGQVDDSMEVIVVFDGCSKETLDAFFSMHFCYAVIEVISVTNVGRSSARNLGAKRASGEILILLDDDRVPCKDFVKMHIEAHKTRCILLGNRKDVHLPEPVLQSMMSSEEKLRDFTENMEASAVTAFDSHDKLLRRILFFRHNPIIWILFYTGNVSLEKNDLEKAGFFDENFKGWGYEDLELGYRLYKNKIPFVKGVFVLNYHLSHEISVTGMLEAALKNLRYFHTKVKGDILARFVIFLLAAPLYLRIFQRDFIRSSVLKKQAGKLDTH